MMMTQHLHPPIPRPLLETLRQNETLVALLVLFRAMVRREPVPDTEIAWEDGEVGDGTETRR